MLDNSPVGNALPTASNSRRDGSSTRGWCCTSYKNKNKAEQNRDAEASVSLRHQDDWIRIIRIEDMKNQEVIGMKPPTSSFELCNIERDRTSRRTHEKGYCCLGAENLET
jgi:hypothetical protein